MKSAVFLITILVLSGIATAAGNVAAGYSSLGNKSYGNVGTVSISINKNIDKIICCKSWGYGTGMIETNTEYNWKQQNECKTPENFVGGEMLIVADKFCIGIKEVGIKMEVKGLNNAIYRVKNNETRQHLEEVLAKILDQRKEILTKLNNLTIRENDNDNIEAEGLKDMKFLGIFKVKRYVKYIISETGELQKQKRPFDNLFQET